MNRLTSTLMFLLGIAIVCRIAPAADSARILHYEVTDGFGDHLCDYCYEVTSGVHWYEWASIGSTPAVLATFDGKLWSVAVYRADFSGSVVAISLFAERNRLGKAPKLLHSDESSDHAFQPLGASFYTYAPVDAFLAEMDIQEGDLTKLASALKTTADQSRDFPFALSRSLKPNSIKLSMRGVMTADGFPSTFVIERGDTVINRPKTPTPRLLKFRRTEVNLSPWDVESRLDSEGLRRDSKRVFSDE